MNVKRCIMTMVFVLGFGTHPFGIAQAPAGAPAGSTGQCTDGSYTNAAKKAGACRGHKGVQTWFAATAISAAPAAAAKHSAAVPAPTPAVAPAAKAPVAATAPVPSPKPSSTSTVAQAAGGGPGMVWVNTSTKVYHCSGTQYYGKTKEGKYMTEAQASAAGAHPDHGKACGQ